MTLLVCCSLSYAWDLWTQVVLNSSLARVCAAERKCWLRRRAKEFAWADWCQTKSQSPWRPCTYRLYVVVFLIRDLLTLQRTFVHGPLCVLTKIWIWNSRSQRSYVNRIRDFSRNYIVIWPKNLIEIDFKFMSPPCGIIILLYSIDIIIIIIQRYGPTPCVYTKSGKSCPRKPVQALYSEFTTFRIQSLITFDRARNRLLYTRPVDSENLGMTFPYSE